jgi:hypothetical protein
MLLKCLFCCWLVALVHVQSTEIGCILWKNTFVKIEKQIISESQTSYIFIVHSKQRTGYMSIGFFSKPHMFEDSILVVGYLPNNVIELKNHTIQVSQKKIFGERVRDENYNRIDGTLSFTFTLNATHVDQKNYFAFAQNKLKTPYETNGTINIPKHWKFSEYRYFEFNATKFSVPICRYGLNVASRITVANTPAYIATLLFYTTLFLFIIFRDEQPFKSRFAAPYIALFCGTLSDFIENSRKQKEFPPKIE